MTFYFIHFLLLHSFYCTEELSHERGKDFVDNFETYDDSLWIQDNGTVHCTNHRVRGCALMTKRNIGYYTLAANNFFQDRHILSLWMLNNCNSDLCCPNEKCTAYTSAQMISRKVYSYGIYLFLARAVGYNVRANSKTYGSIDCIFCVTLRSSKHRIEMSFCFSSIDPYKATCIYRNGDESHKETVSFPFDASTHVSYFGIDWRPYSIVFFVNQAPAKVIETGFLGYVPMRVYLHLLPLPRAMNVGHSFDSVGMVVHLYRFSYQQVRKPYEILPTTPPEKAELLIMEESSSMIMIYIMAFSFFVFMISFSFWICHGFSRDHSGEYFLLKDSDEETLTRATRS